MAGRWDELADELAAGAQERFVADLTGRFVAMLAEGVDNPDMLALYTRSVAESEALRVWAAHEAGVSAEVRAAFEEAMAGEDVAATRPPEGFGALADAAGAAALSNRARARAGTAARQLAKVIARQNVALCETAARAWWGAVADAVVSVQAGGSRSEAMERACRAMADAGVETVDYLTGRRTAVDAAVRRHVVTQQAQCRAESLDDAMDAWGLDLVYVTAHYGARPDHAAWQGRVYSRHGITPGYPALAEATGYGTPGGLCGCNCRHRFHPYVPGESRLPDASFESQRARFGMTGDEYYEATQRQRALERSVREAKRRVAVGAAQGLEMTSDRYLLGVRQARLAAHVRASGLTRDYARERAYGVGEQPGALRSAARREAREADSRARDVRSVLGSGSGGEPAGSMELMGRIDPRDRAMVREAVAQCKESVRGLAVEHAWVIQRDGAVLHGSGDAGSVSLDGADLDGAVVVHNHPLVDGASYSFGKDDYDMMASNPGMSCLHAVSELFDYSAKPLRKIEVGYDYAKMMALGETPAADIDDDIQHLVMEWADHAGYVRYSRKKVRCGS